MKEDPDAKKFCDRIGITHWPIKSNPDQELTDEEIRLATTELCKLLKQDGIWDKVEVILPMIKQ